MFIGEPTTTRFAKLTVAKPVIQDLLGVSSKKWSKIQRGIISGKDWKKYFKPEMKMKINIEVEDEIIETENVCGLIEGTDKKEEVVVLSAHYDHIGANGDKVFNGADDDGSGTVTIMEMAQAFAKAKAEGKGPRRSVLIIGMTGEEKGLLGSEYYSNHPIFPLENTVVNLNTDMVGRLDEEHEDDPNYVYIIGSDMLSSDLHNISEQVNTTYQNIKFEYKYNEKDEPNRYYYRSDHYNFAKNGIPVIFYFNGTHADYHKETDTVDKILFDKIENIGRLIFYTAWELSNREDRIVVDKSADEE